MGIASRLACIYALFAALAHWPVPAPAQVASGVLQRFVPTPQCINEAIVGTCMCGYIPCGVRVTEFVPVAFVETTREPGESLVGPVSSSLPPVVGTTSSSLSTTDNTSEAHVWTMPQTALSGANCQACPTVYAMVPAVPSDPSALACGSAASVTQAILGMFNPTGASGAARLVYASERDSFNWRTGCRDLNAASSPLVGQPWNCTGSVNANSINGVADGTCLGAWGALRPRQMRDIGPPPILYSAKTSVRAMSIARDQLGLFPYPVDVLGKLEQLYPSQSMCFQVGQLPLPEFPLGVPPVVTSPDGRYGWVYWRLTTCCKSYAAAMQCMAR
jgi:hypothetical protein